MAARRTQLGVENPDRNRILPSRLNRLALGHDSQRPAVTCTGHLGRGAPWCRSKASIDQAHRRPDKKRILLRIIRDFGRPEPLKIARAEGVRRSTLVRCWDAEAFKRVTTAFERPFKFQDDSSILGRNPTPLKEQKCQVSSRGQP